MGWFGLGSAEGPIREGAIEGTQRAEDERESEAGLLLHMTQGNDCGKDSKNEQYAEAKHHFLAVTDQSRAGRGWNLTPILQRKLDHVS
jgi:hypothetical protein